ncbi:uncharacterized protein [Oscarella lobularis]|uniref:uncharacterized protein n=1 Tax=Oscarella lobularis TaxID=121494 RepID=UPI0033135629
MLKPILLLVFPFIHTVSAMTPPLLEAESLSEPSWLNLNTTRVPAIPHPGQTVTVVTYGLENYFHSLMTPQFICRYTSKGDRGLSVNTDYARLRKLEDDDPCLVIDCPLESVASWEFDERTALVSVLFRKKAGLKFVGFRGANEISFISEWTCYEYDTIKAIIVIYGISLDPEYDHTIILTLDNGKKITACARPKTLTKIVYNLKDDIQTLEEEHMANITIETTQGVIVYRGDKGDSVVLQPLLHAACHPDNHKVVDQPWRKISNTATYPRYCDQRSVGIRAHGWNRIDPKIGGNMPQSCPSYNRCGTYGPGWLRDPLPTEKGMEMANTVCFRWNCYCCNYKTPIKVINCGEFYVYWLPPPPRCDMAYCGNH